MAKRLTYELNCRLKIVKDQLSWNAKNAEPCASQRTIPPGICTLAQGVVATVDFHDEPRPHGDEVDDEAADVVLTTEVNTELVAADGVPERRLRRRKPRAQRSSPGFEERTTFVMTDGDAMHGTSFAR